MDSHDVPVCWTPLEWANDRIKNRLHVNFTEFVKALGFWNEEDAQDAFVNLLSNTALTQQLRTATRSNYDLWRRNEGKEFWADRAISSKLSMSAKTTAVGIISKSERIIGTHLEEDKSKSISSPSNINRYSLPCAASSSTTATTSAFYDPKSPFLDTSKPASNPKGTPTAAESDDVQAQSDTRARKRGRMDSVTSREARTRSELPNLTANLEQFAALNQEVEWIVEGEDLVQKFREFRAQNLEDFSLVRDGIADVTINSKFRKSLAPNIGRAANRVDPISNLHEHWPTLNGVLERVFAESHYDSVDRAIGKENFEDPVVRYVMSIIHSYSHYFSFHSAIPTYINERQGFADLTWCFIRNAMTMTRLETQYLEVLITGVQERKNWERNDPTEAKQIGQFADGVTTWGSSQLFLSEASTIHNAKAEKLRQDEFKLARSLRDSWVTQVKATSKHSIPRRGMAVYGSSTFNDETKFWRLDFCGVFRLIQFDAFFVPLQKSEFGTKAKEAILGSLKLAMRIKAEVSAREEDTKPVDYEQRELLQEMANSIQLTTSTPTKIHKKRPAPFSHE